MSDFVVAWIDLDDSGSPVVIRRTYDSRGRLISVSPPVPLPVFVRSGDSGSDNLAKSERRDGQTC